MALTDQLPEEQDLTSPSEPALPSGSGGGESELSKGISDEEVDQRAGGLEAQFADDRAPGQGQDESTGGPDSGSSSLSGNDSLASNKAAAKAKEKREQRKKRLKRGGWIAAAIVAALTPIILILLFLFLFKLNHIKELFIDYRFAKFDRIVSERIKAALDESKKVPDGAADAAPAAADAPLETQLAQAKADGLSPDISTQELDTLTSQVDAYMQSDLPDAPGGEIDSEFGVKDRAVDAADDTKTQAETDVAVDKELETRVDDPNVSNVPEGATGLKDSVDEAKAEVGKGTPPATAAENASKGLAERVTSGLNYAAIATFACIGLDIWGAGEHAYIAYKAGGLVKAAESVYAWADGQKQGQVPLSGIGAIADKFDNGNESFINSAGGQQASGQPITGPGLSPDAQPSHVPPFGTVGQIIHTFSSIPGVTQACQKLLEPAVQAGIAAGSVVLLVGAIVTGGVSLTVGAVVTSVGIAAASVLAGPVGKALLIGEISNLAHSAISANAGPVDWGNYVSGGTKVMADSSCLQIGCQQLTASQSQALNTVMRQEELAKAKQKGPGYTIFALSNPRSVLARTFFALPSSPGALVGRIDTIFASLFNPAKWAMSGGHLAMATISPNTAYADNSAIDPVTGQPYVGAPVTRPTWDMLDNATYVEANLDRLKQSYGDCFGSNADIYAQRIIDGPNSKCDQALQSDPDAQRYAQYLADKVVVHALMLLKNRTSTNSTTPSTPPGSSPPTPSSGTVIVLDPGHSAQDIQSIDPDTGLIDHDYPNIPEINEVWEVTQKVKTKLEADGYTVVLTKDSNDESVSNRQRANIANESGAALAVSIHDDHGQSWDSFAQIYAQQVGLHRDPANGSPVTFDNAEVAQKSQQYAQFFATTRAAAEGRKVVVTTNNFNNRPGLSPGNIALVQLFSHVPWVYNEVGAAPANQTLSEARLTAYANGIISGIEQSVPPPKTPGANP